MSVKTWIGAVAAALFSMSPTLGLAQGFAGMGQDADGFALPDPNTRFSFPTDHAAHPEFRIEWWYITVALTGADGQPYGLQWTLFRNAARPTGAPEDQVWMGHAAVSTPDGHFAEERLARGATGQAGVETDDGIHAYIDEWNLVGPDLANIRLSASGPDFAYTLELKTNRPFVPQGAAGYSVKSEDGLASHYYSQPFYAAQGVIRLADGTETQVSGQGWLDREWSSQPLAPDQTGWDWIALHLDGGDKLMGYRLRREDGSAYTVGTWITSDGKPTAFAPGDLTMTVAAREMVAGREVPVEWDVSLPMKDLTVRVSAIYPQSWMDMSVPYWEGPVRVTGSHAGVGYLEMTGYE